MTSLTNSSGRDWDDDVLRPLPVTAPMVYTSDVTVAAGRSITAHVSSPGAFEVSIVHVPPSTVLVDQEHARRSVTTVVEASSARAAPQAVRPGSYMKATGSLPYVEELTVGGWVRLWRLPPLDVVQWAWSSVISDFDYPHHCRFALLIDHAGCVGFYVGEGVFVHDHLVRADTDLGARLGEWVHLAAAVDVEGVARIHVDGQLVAQEHSLRLGPPGPEASLRIGAAAEAGLVDGFLDADVAQPFVACGALAPDDIRRIADDHAMRPLSSVVPTEVPMWGHWPFSDPTNRWVDASGNGHHGTVRNSPVTNIGGPSSDRASGSPSYRPEEDPRRGSAVRFASDDMVDAGWPAALTCTIPDDAPSGIYAARLHLHGQELQDCLHAPFVVSRRRPRQSNGVALLCATNTWLAYGRRPVATRRAAGLEASFYSRHLSGNPYFHVGVRAPIPQVDPFGFESARAARSQHSHLVRPELCALEWLRQQGFAHEAISDTDLHLEPELLSRYRVLLIAGHNEYWSDTMRAAIDDFLTAGGAVVSLSGNTGCWRVSFDAEAGLLESRKVVDGPDERWLTPETWGDRWHAHEGGPGGSFVSLGRPAHEVLGTDTQGMIDDGTPTAFSGFTVVAPEHFLFHNPARVPVPPDGVIGRTSLNGPAASGYEFDATAKRLGLSADHPPGLTVLASAFGQRNLEWHGVQSDHGGDIVYWDRPRGGQVLVIGSIGATGSLLSDGAVDALVANAMRVFGVAGAKWDSEAEVSHGV